MKVRQTSHDRRQQADMAGILGYSGASAFRGWTGITPADWRKRRA